MNNQDTNIALISTLSMGFMQSSAIACAHYRIGEYQRSHCSPASKTNDELEYGWRMECRDVDRRTSLKRFSAEEMST